MDRIADVAAAIITLAIIATLVGSRNTANEINAIGSAFQGSIRAAKGK